MSARVTATALPLMAAALLASAPTRAQDHRHHDHGAMQSAAAAPVAPAGATEPVTPIPELTDADREAAFPRLSGDMQHAASVNSFVLIDRLELWDAQPGTGLGWEVEAWIGSDINRLWLHSDGEHVDDVTEAAALEVLYGRSFTAWWDVVAGVRHDFKPGASRNWAAFGIKGLMPGKFEVTAMLYAAESGHFAASMEIEYDLLITNRLILQPLVALDYSGKSDPQRGIASGLQDFEAGLRLRYEFSRQFAPYIGVHSKSDTTWVAGIRAWF